MHSQTLTTKPPLSIATLYQRAGTVQAVFGASIALIISFAFQGDFLAAAMTFPLIIASLIMLGYYGKRIYALNNSGSGLSSERITTQPSPGARISCVPRSLDLVQSKPAQRQLSSAEEEFAQTVALDIYNATKMYSGGAIQIECHTNPYEIIILNLHSTMAPPCSVGIEFGLSTANGNKTTPQSIDIEAWNENPENPLSSHIYVHNLSVAWRILCLY